MDSITFYPRYRRHCGFSCSKDDHGGKIPSSSFMDVISCFSSRLQLLVIKNGYSSNNVGNEKASHLFCWYEELKSHRYLVVEI
ncbi:hypothetical protein NC651_000370 [Populus alba x Populus x berolinensis]|nr:hypothetical protein NC651_000370 [Populus alba x Populus x berolinensis]